MCENINEIQETRARLKKIILEDVKPIRKKLDGLLNEQAVLLCPFKIDDIITLDNGKKGIIKEISHHSLNYDFMPSEEFEFFDKFDEITSIYAYSLDDKEFTITWQCSGLRMIQNDTVVGKVTFSDISPDKFDIDVDNKKVTQKSLNSLVDNIDFLTDLSAIVK
ncbi:hypothetical protein BZG02_19020 [Labilibaculum filiforme]|uniref:Uncharacterized protein n=1 Tax=Labilibaculum filiforme TaxID=1940526 RepID=A0A2N3HR71_9BACT|nr:hypothetical protein [Labilibaculum filiforme]PKQ60558.1 hypothetical protein BZG02_19020 [Labilibaculum filiforme]